MATTEALIHPTTTTATTTLSDDSIDQSTTTTNTLTIPTITTTLSNNNYHHNNSSNAHDVTQSTTTTTTTNQNNNHQKMTSSFNLSVQIPTSSSSHQHQQHQQSQQHATIRSNNHHTSTDTMMMMDSDVIHVTESVIFRTIRREDLSDLHHLQLELFPVRYKDDFYQSLLVKDNTLTILAIHRQTRKLIGVCSCRVYEHDTGSALLSWIYEFLSSIVSANGSFVGLSRSDNNRQNQSVQKQQQEQQQYNDRFGYIMTLGVTRSYRRQGLASQMVEILIRRMVEKPYYCSSLTLHCKVDNERALKFYHKHGFIVEDRVRDYYDFAGVREDAFHLVKHLSLPEISHDGITPIDIHQQQLRSSSTLEAEQKREQYQWIQRYGYTFGWISIFCAWIVALFFKLTEVFEEHWLSLCSAMTTTTTSASTTMTTNSASASISSASSSASSFASSTGAPSFATQQQQHNKRIMTNHNSAHGHHRSNRSHVTT